MNVDVERPAGTWPAAVRLAVAVSVVAAAIAVIASVAGDVPQVAIVLPVIVVGFAVSWIQSGRPQSRRLSDTDDTGPVLRPVRVHSS